MIELLINYYIINFQISRKHNGIPLLPLDVIGTVTVAIETPKSLDVPRGRQPRRNPLATLATTKRLELARDPRVRIRTHALYAERVLVTATASVHVSVLRRETG